MTVIKPTVGRVVWVYPPDTEQVARIAGEPLAGMIARVHSDTSVNVGYLDATGRHGNKVNVELVQAGGDPPKDRWHCTWMPYQTGQAAKSEALEKQLAEKAA